MGSQISHILKILLYCLNFWNKIWFYKEQLLH